MPSVKVYDQNKQELGDVELSDAVFGVDVKRHLLHAMVRKQLAARRQGTHAVKRRADVSGGGRKPFKQKGTGRARQGTIRAPHMRGGGVVFGPEPRSYDFKINRKERLAALCSALSARVADGTVVVVDKFAFDAPKTKDFKSFLGRFDIGTALVVAEADENTLRSARNLQQVSVVPPQGVNVYDVLRRTHLVLTRDAVDALTARLGGAS